VDVVLVAHESANCEHLGIRLVAAGLTARVGEGSGNQHAFTASRLWPLRAEAPPTLIGIPKADIASGGHVQAPWRNRV